MERKVIRKSLGKRRCITKIEVSHPAVTPAGHAKNSPPETPNGTEIVNDGNARAASPERVCVEAPDAGLSTPIKKAESSAVEAASPLSPFFTSPGHFVPQVSWDYSCPGIDKHLPKGRSMLQSPDWKKQRPNAPSSPLIAFARTSFPQPQYRSPSPGNRNKDALKFFKRVFGEILDKKSPLSAKSGVTEDRIRSSMLNLCSRTDEDNSKAEFISLFDESSNNAMFKCSQAVEEGLDSISLDNHASYAGGSPDVRFNSKHSLSPEMNSCAIKKLCRGKYVQSRPQKCVSNFQSKLKLHENFENLMSTNTLTNPDAHSMNTLAIEIRKIAKLEDTSREPHRNVNAENNNRLYKNLNVEPSKEVNTVKEDNKISNVDHDIAALLDDDEDDKFLSLIDTMELCQSDKLPLQTTSLRCVFSEPFPGRDTFTDPCSGSVVSSKPINGLTSQLIQQTKCEAPSYSSGPCSGSADSSKPINILTSQPTQNTKCAAPSYTPDQHSESALSFKPINELTSQPIQYTKCAVPSLQQNRQPNKLSTHLFVSSQSVKCTPLEIERKRIEAMKRLEERKKRLAPQ